MARQIDELGRDETGARAVLIEIHRFLYPENYRDTDWPVEDHPYYDNDDPDNYYSWDSDTGEEIAFIVNRALTNLDIPYCI